jgi:hypothetical protein
MVKLPAWDTPAWCLARELRPLYAAVNRVRHLEARPGASLAEIAEAQRAVGAAAAELTWLVEAIRLFEEKQTTVRYFGRG